MLARALDSRRGCEVGQCSLERIKKEQAGLFNLTLVDEWLCLVSVDQLLGLLPMGLLHLLLVFSVLMIAQSRRLLTHVT